MFKYLNCPTGKDTVCDWNEIQFGALGHRVSLDCKGRELETEAGEAESDDEWLSTKD